MVIPPISAGIAVALERPAALLYAVVKSCCAFKAFASASWIAPITIPGGNPVTAVPGSSPKAPLIIVGPEFVTVDDASTAKAAAVPRGTVATIPAPWRADDTSFGAGTEADVINADRAMAFEDGNCCAPQPAANNVPALASRALRVKRIAPSE